MGRKLWSLLYAIAYRCDAGHGQWLYSQADIFMVYCWAVVHDRPMNWAVDPQNWPDDLRPRGLPSQSQLSRRMRKWRMVAFMIDVENACLALIGVARLWIARIDGKGVPTSLVTKDADAKYGHVSGGNAKGYKLHTVWSGGPLPLAWALAPMNVSEKTIAAVLIPGLPGAGYLLGDPEYDANHLFEAAHAAGYQLLTPKRQKHRGLGHRPQSPYRLRSIEMMKKPFGRALYRFRRQIERDFGNLVSFGGGLICLPPWARRFPRVRNWIHTKLLINAARHLNKHPELAPA